MRFDKRAGTAIVLLGVGLVGPVASATAGPTDDESTLELRVMTYAALGSADLDQARQTATSLLATAGLRVVWHVCGGDECAEPASGRSLTVHLLPVLSKTNPAMSGEVVRSQTSNGPTILVYVPRNAEVTQAIRRSPAARSNPALSSLVLGHLVGLTIAHEVGHSLGLSHTSSGPMKAQPDPEDLIAMRSARLHFPALKLPPDLAARPVTSVAIDKAPF